MTVSAAIVLTFLALVSGRLTEGTEEIHQLQEIFGQYDTFLDPIGQVDLTLQQIIEENNNIRLFSSTGLIISNHLVNLTLLTGRLDEINEGLLKLQKLEGVKHSPHLKALLQKKVKVENLISSHCELRSGQKRFVISVPTLIVSVALGAAAGGATAFATNYALGTEEDIKLTEESVGIAEKLDIGEETVDRWIEKSLKDHNRRLNDHERRLYVIEQSKWLENGLEQLFQYGLILNDLDNYNYENSNFIDSIQARIRNDTDARALMGEVRYGLFGPQSLLTMSESEIVHMTTKPGSYACEDSALMVKIKTVVPQVNLPATPTEKDNKWRVTDSVSLYVNRNFILQNSPHRKSTTFTKLRSITGENNIIKDVLVYNNTLLFIQTEGNFQMKKLCPNESRSFTVYKNPVMRVPHSCALVSQFLNVSTYTTVFPLYDVADASEIHDATDDEFLPVYHPQEDTKFEEQKIHEVLEEMFVLRRRTTQIEREKLEIKKRGFNFSEWASRTWNNVIDWVGSGLKSIVAYILAQPAIGGPIIGFSLILLVVIIFLIVRKCKQKKKVIQVLPQKATVETTSV